MTLFDLVNLDDELGARLLSETCAMGFSEPVARRGLKAEFDAWSAPGAVDRVLGEVSDIDPVRYPREVLVVGAATLPVSTLRACLMARLLGARVRVKPASGRDGLAEAIAAADELVTADCFASTDRESLARALDTCDTVVALGSDETLAALAGELKPHQTFVGYGHRVSAAHVSDPTTGELAGLAEDILAWDGHGCMSPQVIWTDRPIEETAQALIEELRRLECDLPFRPSAEMAHAHYVTQALGAMGGSVLKSETSSLILRDDPGYLSGPGGRLVYVLPDRGEPWRDLGSALSTLGCSSRSSAQTGLRSTRRCDLGQMQSPPLDWPHDGQPNLLPMLRAPDEAN